jgi:hypothetical protein
VRESERAGKKGRAIDVDPAEVEEAARCGLCGDSLIEGHAGSWEPRGGYHVGCIRAARREALEQQVRDGLGSRGGRRRRRRS